MFNKRESANMETATPATCEATTPQKFIPFLHELLAQYGISQDENSGVARNGAPPLDIKKFLLELAQGINHNIQVPQDSIQSQAPPPFPPLALVTKPNLTTAEAAYYLNRRPQTLRGWACHEDGPIRPRRIGGLLAWSSAQVKALAGIAL